MQGCHLLRRAPVNLREVPTPHGQVQGTAVDFSSEVRCLYAFLRLYNIN